ncbi:MAG: quinone-interacting membrane-bound oxidoreductase complex subunit QmoC [candidate division Zixibacteria bacterium]|nr:quinone-interacting membrane-bound oxidoreductase complex subunit QmoC [candidate division Zixibacteria bacterium]
MDTAENSSQEKPEAGTHEVLNTTDETSAVNAPVLIEPDLGFIQALEKQGGQTLKQCIQCGTCAGTCMISPDKNAFPCKEMAWAAWGMKERLMIDPDIWLCYQCNDCSTRCPRGAKPGYVMGALRQECVQHFAFPRFLGRWVNQPQCLPLLAGIPIALLALALYLRGPVEKLLGMSRGTGDEIVFAYSHMFPHWLLNSFFGLFTALMIFTVVVGVNRFWLAMNSSTAMGAVYPPVKGLWPSIVTVIKNIFTHDKFSTCDKAHIRLWSHTFVFFGFLALTLVTLWVITARINPLIQGNFIYPFSFFNPWKVLANAGGLAMIIGLVLMIRDRVKNAEKYGAGSYFDWSLIAILLAVLFSGFFTEALHYVRLEPHRHLIYFVHLVCVFMLLMYLPYSKFAHIVYRTTALVFAEYTGRDNSEQRVISVEGKTSGKEEVHA